LVLNETVDVRIDSYILGLNVIESKVTDFPESPKSILFELDLVVAPVEANGVIARHRSSGLLFNSFFGHLIL